MDTLLCLDRYHILITSRFFDMSKKISKKAVLLEQFLWQLVL